jgi:NAD(P)H dehydrogenase (quinone)
MFAVMGVTGNVGGEVARTLLAAGQQVRAIVRDPQRAAAWAELGCELAQADIAHTASLTAAFTGAEGVFILVPPSFDPQPGFPEAQATAAILREAIEAARPGRVVYLSTIGAQSPHTNLLSQHTLIEQALNNLPIPITFLRPGWFIENSSWDVASARDNGLIQSFLQPLDKPVPMVSTVDIGRLAARLLQQSWTGPRVAELEGPHRITPNEIASTFAKILGHPVRAEAIPRDTWKSLFGSQGMKNPDPRVQMLDGFNEGWIEFEAGEAGSLKGDVSLEIALTALVPRSA